MRTKQNLPTQYYCGIDVSNSIAPHIYVQVFSLIQIYSTFSPFLHRAKHEFGRPFG